MFFYQTALHQIWKVFFKVFSRIFPYWRYKIYGKLQELRDTHLAIHHCFFRQLIHNCFQTVRTIIAWKLSIRTWTFFEHGENVFDILSGSKRIKNIVNQLNQFTCQFTYWNLGLLAKIYEFTFDTIFNCTPFVLRNHGTPVCTPWLIQSTKLDKLSH